MWTEKGRVTVTLLLGILLATMVRPSSGKADGAPPEACDNLIPSHGFPGQSSASPYTITFTPASFTPEGPAVNVTLTAPSSVTGFKGFLLTTRYEGTNVDQTVRPGTFESLPQDAKLACSSKAVTHTDSSVKQSVSVQWKPPSNSGGNVRFRATFVQAYQTFWVDTAATNLLMDASSQSNSSATTNTPGSTPGSTSTATAKITKDADCGRTKGCYSDCTANGCTFQLTWAQGTSADNVAITLSAVVANTAGRYIAFGLSYDKSMGNDSVTYCIDGPNGVYNSFNPAGAKFNRLLDTNPQDGLANVNIGSTNGVLTCSFTRVKAVDSSGERFALDVPYTILFAMGPGDARGAQHHDVAPQVSPQMASLVNFTADMDGTAPAQPTTTATPQTAKITKDTDCGRTKGCYSDCTANGCTFQLTWAQGTSADNVAITLSAVVANTAGRYIAFGLSYDKSMGNDSVTYCIDGPSGVYNSFNAAGAKFNRPVTNPQDGLANINIGSTNGVLTCSFTRIKAVDSNGERFALDVPYTILFAMGPGSASGAQRHDVAPKVSPQMASLVDFTADVSGTGPPQPTTTATPQTRKISSDPGCGSSKGCYSDCNSNGCTFLFSWALGTSNDNVAITLSVAMDDATGRYIALGLSNDEKMGSDSVMYCINAANGAFLSYNVDSGTNNVQLAQPKDGLSNIQTKYENGVLSCSFNRVKAAGSNGQRFALDKAYKLFFASGTGSASGLQIHSKIPLISTQAASLVDFTVNIGGSSSFPLIKAHGSLMIVAWIFAASIGIFFARYFKDVWQNSTWCSQKIWFQIHRTCMVLAFCATVCAFVIIFVQVKGYSQIQGEGYKKAHPILGIIVTALTVINPVMALFRPHPNTPKRPIFNWAHWLVGSGAHILGVITIFFGVLLSKSGAPNYTIYILAAYVGWQVLIQILMELVQCIARSPKSLLDCCKSMSGRSSAYEMSDMNGEQSKPPQEEESSFKKRILLYLHIMVIIGFTIALIVVINTGQNS